MAAATSFLLNGVIVSANLHVAQPEKTRHAAGLFLIGAEVPSAN
jgi:hypothetical protein